MREMARALLAAGLSVATVTVLFVWPGFLAPAVCEPLLLQHESVKGRTYCFAPPAVPVAPERWMADCLPVYTNLTLVTATPLWGFTFRVWDYLECEGSTLLGAGSLVNITEPNGTSYQHTVPILYWQAYWPSPPPPINGTPPRATLLWVAPENESGLSYDSYRTPQLLALVLAGE